MPTRNSSRLDVRRLLALGALAYIEAHLLVLQQGLETFRPDLREMGEQFLAAVVGGDETETLCIAKPLYSSGRHGRLLAGKRGTVSRVVLFVRVAIFARACKTLPRPPLHGQKPFRDAFHPISAFTFTYKSHFHM
jgi:hypothetical protein